MKLSKNKLNKIKVRKDGSRKKNHLRRNKKNFDNSKKKHNRKSHLKNKTLKIYFGGANEHCQYKNIELNKNTIAYFTKLSQDEKKKFITTYFLPEKNKNCLQEARDNLLIKFQYFYKDTDPKPTDEQLVELKDLWENKLDPFTLQQQQRTSLAIDLNDVKSEPSTPTKAPPSEEVRKQQIAQEKETFEDFCKSINPVTDTSIYSENLNAISNKIKAKSTKALIAKPNNLVRKIGNIDLYAVETTAEGECMYSSFIYGMLLKQIGNWNKIPGWKPEEKLVEGDKKCNYMGNLRPILLDYICKNQTQLEDLYEPKALLQAAQRIQNGSWGEEAELKIMARMFDVCLALFKSENVGNVKGINENIWFYNRNGVNMTKDVGESPLTQEEIDKTCGNNIVYLIEYQNYHFQSVVPIISSVSSSQTESRGDPQSQSSSISIPASVPNTGIPNIYPCSVDGINSELPDTEEEALKVLAKLDSILLHCSNDKYEPVIEFLVKYITDYETKFGKQPEYISQHCQGLFKGDYDYNIVPDNEEEALNKFNKFLEFIVDQESKPDFNCVGAANMALDIYIKKLEEKYGQDILFKNTMNAPSPTSGDCGDMFKGEMAPNFVPNTKEAAIKKLKQYEAMLEKDKNEDGSRCESQITDTLNIYKPKMELMYPVEASGADASGVPSGTSGADASGVPSGTSGVDTSRPATISNEKIEQIFNKIQTAGEINQEKLIQFLIDISDEDSILIRKVIGFDEPLTMSQIDEVRNIGNQDNWSKNAQIFNSLTKTYEQMQSGGGGKNVQKGGSGEMNLEDFTKFVNCGQYRNKSQNTFDCQNVNIRRTSGSYFSLPSFPSFPSLPSFSPFSSFPMATASAGDDKNITLEINEKQYSNDIKMVTVHMFVPKESQVIVKDYAKNTEAEMISSLPDGLPAPEPIHGLPYSSTNSQTSQNSSTPPSSTNSQTSQNSSTSTNSFQTSQNHPPSPVVPDPDATLSTNSQTAQNSSIPPVVPEPISSVASNGNLSDILVPDSRTSSVASNANLSDILVPDSRTSSVASNGNLSDILGPDSRTSSVASNGNYTSPIDRSNPNNIN